MATLSHSTFMNFDMKVAIESMTKYKYVEFSRNQGKTLMSCYRTNREMEELRRCGCNECYREYRRLEDRYYRERDYYRTMPMALTGPVMVATKEEIKVEKIEEPKNYAVKKLVDELKVQQTGLASKKAGIDTDKNMIKMYQGTLKTKNIEKLTIESKIKELSVALKKLGHKE